MKYLKYIRDRELAVYLGYPEDTVFESKGPEQVKQEEQAKRDGAKEFEQWMDEREYQESEMAWDGQGGDRVI